MTVSHLDAMFAPTAQRLLGPGDVGLVVPALGLAAGPAFAGVTVPREGHCAWVAQDSDAARAALVFGQAHGLGLSRMIALGDALEIDLAETIDYLACDPHSKAVLLVLTRVRAARKFMSAVRACVRNKPVLVWCAPALGESPLAYDAALERAGVVRVPDLAALYQAWAVLQSPEVGASTLLARYRAARERLSRTPPALPPHRLAYADAQSWLHHQDMRSGPVVLGDAQVRRLLDDFDIVLHADPDTAAPEPTAGSEQVASLGFAMRDEVGFGPLLTLARGALWNDGATPAEAALQTTSGKTVAALPPLDAALAGDLLEAAAPSWPDSAELRLPAETALRGRRALVDLLVRLSDLLCCVEQIVALEATLTLCGGVAGLRHIRVVLGPRGARRPLAVRPYPRELEETRVWDDLTLILRPIRPEDEDAHRAFLQALTPDDLRLRFFGAMRVPSHEQIARFVQIDYDREMAFVACSEEGGATCIHGVVRAVADPDNDSAEFAVTVRSGEQGHHLGRLLMERIIAYCRRRGTRVLVGEILRENSRMLALARDCGFTFERDEDPGVVSVRLILNAPPHPIGSD
jgi:RimJ/RimL family protein N-acetyltransferase